MASDTDEIRRLVEERAAAVGAKDAKAMVAHHAPTVVEYNLAPPLRQSSDGRDTEQAKTLGSDIENLRNRGVPVKLDKSTAHMHHKYAIPFLGRVPHAIGLLCSTRRCLSPAPSTGLARRPRRIVRTCSSSVMPIWPAPTWYAFFWLCTGC